MAENEVDAGAREAILSAPSTARGLAAFVLERAISELDSSAQAGSAVHSVAHDALKAALVELAKADSARSSARSRPTSARPMSARPGARPTSARSRDEPIAKTNGDVFKPPVPPLQLSQHGIGESAGTTPATVRSIARTALELAFVELNSVTHRTDASALTTDGSSTTRSLCRSVLDAALAEMQNGTPRTARALAFAAIDKSLDNAYTQDTQSSVAATALAEDIASTQPEDRAAMVHKLERRASAELKKLTEHAARLEELKKTSPSHSPTQDSNTDQQLNRPAVCHAQMPLVEASIPSTTASSTSSSARHVTESVLEMATSEIRAASFVPNLAASANPEPKYITHGGEFPFSPAPLAEESSAAGVGKLVLNNDPHSGVGTPEVRTGRSTVSVDSSEVVASILQTAAAELPSSSVGRTPPLGSARSLYTQPSSEFAADVIAAATAEMTPVIVPPGSTSDSMGSASPMMLSSILQTAQDELHERSARSLSVSDSCSDVDVILEAATNGG
jgi:hypothetical protein